MHNNDLSQITLHLCVTHNDTIPGWLGRAIQGIYLHAMEAIAPEVSLAIHDSAGYHPYTLSDVLPMAKSELRELKRGQMLTVVLTTLHSQVTHLTLNTVVPRWIDEGVDLHGQLMRVSHAEIKSTSYEALLAENASVNRRTISMQFLTPTSTKKSRRRSDTNERRESQVVPLPMPDRIFNSLYERWNRFAPQPLPEELKLYIEDEISVQHCNIRTHYVDRQRANKGGTVGFMGDVTFHCTSGESPWLGYIHTLAAFAPYSGVGIKTTQGMGTVQLQPQREKAGLQ